LVIALAGVVVQES